jgi:hypothetical protein
MSRKSRHHRHLPRSKRRKFSQGFAPPQPSPVAPQPPAATPQPPMAAQQYESAPRAETVAPQPRAPAPRPAVPLAQPPNIAAELRMIGILSGVILVIMIVLAFVLH